MAPSVCESATVVFSEENENRNKTPVNMYPHKSFIKKTKTKNMTCDHELCTDHISYHVKKLMKRSLFFPIFNAPS